MVERKSSSYKIINSSVSETRFLDSLWAQLRRSFKIAVKNNSGNVFLQKVQVSGDA